MANERRNHLFIRVDELPIATFIRNRLKEAGIVYVGDLVQKTEKELLYIQNFGGWSLVGVNTALSMLGLELGMTIRDWIRNSD